MRLHIARARESSIEHRPYLRSRATNGRSCRDGYSQQCGAPSSRVSPHLHTQMLFSCGITDTLDQPDLHGLALWLDGAKRLKNKTALGPEGKRLSLPTTASRTVIADMLGSCGSCGAITRDKIIISDASSDTRGKSSTEIPVWPLTTPGVWRSHGTRKTHYCIITPNLALYG
ncbi:hypothetical protein L210DRAFT_404398 [Boletus edulis BED1]|uniref:Uncharacterized protein n=1 Tax=Boletus edulis BED1 TaxID=1328754 RepID=A0AAD4GB15_BOLED|nr:hypothetical protein L210DRAFT_404398 [Boletus edulis BED1]